MDSSESAAVLVETPCSPFNLSTTSPPSNTSSSTCNSCSYIRHHERRRSRRTPTQKRSNSPCNSSSDDENLNSCCNGSENNIIITSTTTMMRLKEAGENEAEKSPQVIMNNCPCDLMMSGEEQDLPSEEDNEAGDLMGNMSVRRKRRVNRGSSRDYSSSSSHIFPEASSNSSSTFSSYSTSSSSRTALLFTFLSVALLMLTGTGGVDGLRINQFGGYEDVVVSVGTDVPPITCQQLIQNLQMIFSSASEHLNGATKGRAYFHRVQIILPATWDSRACGKMLPASYTSASSVGESHFQIDGEHPVFGHRPWTQQSRGCGQQAEKIHVGFQYIMGYNDTDMAHSFPERAIVHEWAKYRYGVYEEIGFENDPIYPTSYYGEDNGQHYGNRGSSSSSSEKRPTSCTNKPLQGSWTGDCGGQSGSASSSHQQQQHNHQSQYHYHHQQSQQYASSSSGESNDRSGNNCVFVPFLTDNRNITSSLMSYPHLLNVKSFCDSTTHNRYAPTKHNFLCDQRSVSEVIYSHPDFHNISTLSSFCLQTDFMCMCV